MSRYIMIRRLRWPVILLLTGVLALLHQAGVVPYFWRLFWPLLLILVGVMLLAERAALAAEGGYPVSCCGVPYPYAEQGAGQGAQQAAGQGTGVMGAGSAGAEIVPAPPHDFENPVNGGER